MTLTKLNTIGSSYEDINGGAHRKAASLIGVPALVRHICLWNTGFDADGHQTEQGLSAEDRAKQFRRYVDVLTKHIQSQRSYGIEFGATDKVHPLDADVRAGTLWLISFWWHGVRASLRLEQHTEYTTLTSILDLSIQPKSFEPSAGKRANYQSRLHVAFCGLAKLFEKGVAESPRYLHIAFLQNEVWKAFEEEVIDAPAENGPFLGNSLGVVYADFRGVVTGSEPTWRDEEPHIFYQPFRSSPDRPRTEYIDHVPPDEEWPRRVLKRLWPLIQAEERLREFEFTASGFLDGRVVYVSALGPRAEEKLASDWDWTPVYFYLHSSTDDPWQIGRLISRLFALGSYRLASTIGINSLIEAGRAPDALQSAVDKAVGAIGRGMQALGRQQFGPPDPPRRRWLRIPFFGRASAPGEEAGVESSTRTAPDGRYCAEAADDAVAEVQRQYQELPDGLFHRLERSNYYIEQFKRESESLREKRIEGFQKYEEFVSRRLGGIFSYIRLLRKRMNDIDTHVSNLGQSYVAYKTAETTCQIDILVRGMNKQDNEIRKIQDFGEAALIGFLLPYYGGSLFIKHVLGYSEGKEPHLLWPAILTIAAGFVVLRRRDEPDDAAEKQRVRLIRLTFLGYIALIWVCVGRFEIISIAKTVANWLGLAA